MRIMNFKERVYLLGTGSLILLLGLSVVQGGELDMKAIPIGEGYAQARAAGERGEFDKAIQLYTELITTQAMPDSLRAKAYHDRGTVYASINNLDLALKDYDSAIRLDGKRVLNGINQGTGWIWMLRG